MATLQGQYVERNASCSGVTLGVLPFDPRNAVTGDPASSAPAVFALLTVYRDDPTTASNSGWSVVMLQASTPSSPKVWLQ